MKTLFKVGLLIIVLFVFKQSIAQNISDYYGTYSGKVRMPKVEAGIVAGKTKGWTLKNEINQITITISHPDKITISVHNLFEEFETGKEADGIVSLESSGVFNGFINADLSFDVAGIMNHKGIFGTHKGSSAASTTVEGKIFENSIVGDFIFNESKEDFAYLAFDIPLKKEKQDCDFNIVVPSDLKPGSDFYVSLNQSGCISSYTIFYNGKDKPIPQWDGKSVKVEVQAVCCDTRTVVKSIIVPDFGSGKEIIEIKGKQEPFPAPPPEQIATGTLASLLLVKLLEGLLGGKGTGTNKIPPTQIPPSEPKHPRVPDPMAEKPKPVDKPQPGSKPFEIEDKQKYPKVEEKEDKLKPEVTEKKKDIDDKGKKPVSPLDKQKKMEELWRRHEQLLKDAANENQSLNSFFGTARDVIKTVPASFNESITTARRVYDKTHNAFNKFKDFGEEIERNPVEREKFINNVSNISGNLKNTCVNYYKNLEFIDDFRDLKNYFVNDSKQLIRKLYKDPKETIKNYASASIGTENYKSAFDMDKPLEERLLNLGIGYYKTISTLATGEKGTFLYNEVMSKSSSAFNILELTGKISYDHNIVLLRQKLHENFPEIYEKGKMTVIKEGIRIKAKNTYYEFMDQKEKTTTAYNVNDGLERFNSWYEQNLK